MMAPGAWGLCAVPVLAIAAPAVAAPAAVPIDIPAGPLSSALHELARQTRTDLLFDEDVVRGLSAPTVQDRLTPEAALQRLLSGTDLAVRRTASEALIIERRAAADADENEPVTVSEILVVGKRTQNVDIRRRENDVQPYVVSTGEQIVRTHRDDLDQYFRDRVTANTTVVSPSLRDEGETRSEIDLRGLGASDTLILLDGRRLPGLPGPSLGFLQPDLNAVPLHAIERVETLTGTAGGIYGFGALGGVVNVVLKRDFRGAELHATGGVTSRGDAERLALEGRIGFTPDDGRTDVMLYLSGSRSEPLLLGERDYAERDLREQFRHDPGRFLDSFSSANSVSVESFFGDPLTFRSEYGGGPLGSRLTYLPAGFAGTSVELPELLRARAGQIDLSISDPRASSILGSAATVSTGILTVRRRFSSRIEGFLDLLAMINRGRHETNGDWHHMLLFDDSTANPFNEHVWVTFPVSGTTLRKRSNLRTSRYTTGVIADLPGEWRGTAEVTLGSVVAETSRYENDFLPSTLGPPLGPEIYPFGDWETLQRQVRMNPYTSESRARARNRYAEQSFRLGGPLFRTAAGATTLSLLVQGRREETPSFTSTQRQDFGDFEAEVRTPIARRENETMSYSGELRAPLFGRGAPTPLLDDLEVQLAMRHDRLNMTFTPDPIPSDRGEMQRTFRGTAFTAGAKTSPTSWLTIRASYATGVQPPSTDFLISAQYDDFSLFEPDPKREGTFVEGIVYRAGGSPDLGAAEARTWSVGAILNPEARNGPRISVDYSRIRKHSDPLLLNGLTVLANEDYWPERVLREPMTDEDRARGYTAGRVTMVDARALNAGVTTVDSVDARLEWPISLALGRLRLYGAATLQMRNGQSGPFQPEVERVGYFAGPLRWRANAGADWAVGATTLRANVQYFSRYRIYPRAFEAAAPNVDVQGSHWVDAQAYLDLFAGRRFAVRALGGVHDVSVDVGLINALDQSPPRETGFFSALPESGPGYSRYGDPRRRRLQVVLSAAF